MAAALDACTSLETVRAVVRQDSRRLIAVLCAHGLTKLGPFGGGVIAGDAFKFSARTALAAFPHYVWYCGTSSGGSSDQNLTRKRVRRAQLAPAAVASL